jgi:hypothetical protein
MSTSTQSRGDSSNHTEAKGPARPKNLSFMVGWLVFLGFCQIFLAWRFGTFFEGTHGDVRKYFGGAALEPLYAAIGVLALVVAWGGWRLHPWAYRLAWVFQGLVFVVVIGGIAFRIAGKSAPLGWLLLDAASISERTPCERLGPKARFSRPRCRASARRRVPRR